MVDARYIAPLGCCDWSSLRNHHLPLSMMRLSPPFVAMLAPEASVAVPVQLHGPRSTSASAATSFAGCAIGDTSGDASVGAALAKRVRTSKTAKARITEQVG